MVELKSYLSPNDTLGGPEQSDRSTRAVEQMLGVGRHALQGLGIHRDGQGFEHEVVEVFQPLPDPPANQETALVSRCQASIERDPHLIERFPRRGKLALRKVDVISHELEVRFIGSGGDIEDSELPDLKGEMDLRAC